MNVENKGVFFSSTYFDTIKHEIRACVGVGECTTDLICLGNHLFFWKNRSKRFGHLKTKILD